LYRKAIQGVTGVRALERHYKATELAELWGMSVKLVRKIFAAEPGVLKVDRPELRNKRGYCSLRIPESVAISVHKRMSVWRWVPIA
jgi:hypothetical protein